jgi:hypothetical protein
MKKLSVGECCEIMFSNSRFIESEQVDKKSEIAK